jgi:hypothetical protein
MEKVIFIDAERIDQEILTRALVNIDEKEKYQIIILNDAVVVPELKINFKTIESHRNQQVYKKNLFAFIERLFSPLSNGKKSWLTFKTVDILEIIRFDFTFAFDKFYHRYWAINEIRSKWNPKIIYAFYEIQSQNNLSEIKKLEKLSNASFKVSYFIREGSNIDLPRGKYRILKEFKRLYSGALKNLLQGKAQKVKKGSYDIIFYEHYPNSAKIAFYLIEKMKKLGKTCAFLSSKNDLVNENAYFDHYTINSFNEKSALKIIILHLFITIRFLFKFSMISRSKEFNTYLRFGITLFSIKSIFSTISYLIAYKNMSNILNCDHMITTSYSAIFARSYCSYNKEVKSHFIQHGLLIHEDYYLNFMQNKIYVWGEKDKKSIEQTSRKSHQHVHIVGNPKSCDEFLSRNNYNKEQSSTNKYRIVYFSSRVGGAGLSKNDSVAHLEVLLKGLDDYRDVEVIIKMHPGDGVEYYSPYIKGYENVEIVTDKDAAYYIRNSNASIVSTSTVGLEVCHFEKPLLFLNLNDNTRSFSIDYLKYNAAYNIQNVKNMKKCIEALIKIDFKNEFITAQKALLKDMNQDFDINNLIVHF